IASVRSGEAELSRITGAQAPSGVPVVITAPVAERPRRAASSRSSSSASSASSSSSRGRRGRTAQGRPAGETPRRRARRQSALDPAT
ncbi:ATP-dependent helicase, partial [Streptomyces sp. PSKA30]|nr:ATP-dependent helicase [Streptomyces sp. PSKA30]